MIILAIAAGSVRYVEGRLAVEVEDVSEQLALQVPSGAARPLLQCWYCGTTEGPFQTEHQTPVSRGGGGSGNVVTACASCNDLKGPLTLEEFRVALAVRLGVRSVVFSAEAVEGSPATAIRSVRSLGANREVVRLDPAVGERLTRAVMYLRGTGQPRMTRKELAGVGIERWLDDLAAILLHGEDFPLDGAQLSLFAEDEETERPVILRPGELSQTPRVPSARDVTRIDGATLERARRAVDVLRQREDPELALYAFVSGAVDRLVRDVGERYPDLAEALETPATQVRVVLARPGAGETLA